MLTLQNVCIEFQKNTTLNLLWQATKLFWHWSNVIFELTTLQIEDKLFDSNVSFAVQLLSYFFICVIGQWFCAFYFFRCSPCSNVDQIKSFQYPDLSEIQPKNQNHQLRNLILWLHGILDLVCDLGWNNGIKTKTFSLHSLFCWIGIEITASRLQAWCSRSGSPSTRERPMQWYSLKQRDCQAPGVFVKPAEGWGMSCLPSSAAQQVFWRRWS